VSKKIVLLISILCAGLLLSSSSSFAGKNENSSREITIIEHDPYFGQVGGDIVTQSRLNTLYKQLVFDGFTTYGPQGEMLPALAKEWKIAPDWSYIDFILRDDVLFHNGQKVTAEDVKYSYEKYMNKKYRSVLFAFLRKKVKEVTLEDSARIRMHLKGTNAKYTLIDGLRWAFGVFPKQYRETVGDKDFAISPVGCGPFQADSLKQDQWFKVKAVQNHYRKTPKIDSLTVLYVTDPSTRLAMLMAGEADIARVTVEHAGQLLRDRNYQVIKQRHLAGSGLIFADLAFPKEASPFHDIRVREAVSLAIDREMICKKVFFGLHEPYSEVLSPIAWGHDPSVKPDPYDPDKAVSLLKEAGYPNGFNTKIHCSSHLRTEHEAIQACLADIGIKAEVITYERGAFLEAVYGKKIRGLVRGFSWLDARQDPTEDLKAFYGTSFGMAYHTTPEIKSAIDKLDEAKNKDEIILLAKETSKVIRKSRIRAPLWTVPGLWGANQRITNFDPQSNVFALTMLEFIELKQ